MGTGKTSGMIKYINTHPNEKYMFITPFISEIERIINNCPLLNFKQPQDTFSKLADIKNLIANGNNIASTHALFRLFDQSIINLIQQNGYTLILDEVMEVIEPIEISEKDMHMLINDKIISIDDNNVITVTDNNYKGLKNKFNKEIQTIKNHNVIYLNNTLPLCILNPDIFKCFSDIFILTYMFNGSIMQSYCQLSSFIWNYYYIENNNILMGKYNDYNFKTIAYNLINIYEGNLNKIGEKKGALSATWFKNNKKKEEHIILKNNMYNYFKNITKSKSNQAA